MIPIKRSNKIYIYITVLSAIIALLFSFGKDFVISWREQQLSGSISLDASDLMDIFSRAVSLSCILFFFWNKLLWKCPMFRKFSNFPDVSGRWFGYYERTSEGNDGRKHDYVIEIYQTYNDIRCYTYQDTSARTAGNRTHARTENSSRTLLADLLHDGNNEQYQLVFHWGGARTTDEQDHRLGREYHGVTALNFSKGNDQIPAKLHGDYFTNQGTYGVVEVTFESKELKRGL